MARVRRPMLRRAQCVSRQCSVYNDPHSKIKIHHSNSSDWRLIMLDNNTTPSRREFIKSTGGVVAASALMGVAIPRVHAAEDNTLNVALVGCGGRGTGAALDALNVR